MQFRVNLEIPGCSTRWKIKVKVGLLYWSIEDKCLNLPEKWDQRRSYGRNHDFKGSVHRYQGYYIKEVAVITRSFQDRIYIASMGMNTKFKVDSHFLNAWPFIHFSRSMKLQCWNFIWRSTRRVWVVKTFGFTWSRESICSTLSGFLETYATSFKSK